MVEITFGSRYNPNGRMTVKDYRKRVAILSRSPHFNETTVMGADVPDGFVQNGKRRLGYNIIGEIIPCPVCGKDCGWIYGVGKPSLNMPLKLKD